jgi:two-component system, cell cycle sensor histidine kinase PleC
MFGSLPEKYVSYARDIAQSGQHLLRTVNEILDYSRLERGEVVLRREPTRADELITTTVRLVAGQAEARGITLAAQLPETLPLVRVDATKIKQVVINLLSNAIKFTPRSGRVTVAAAMAGPASLQITVADNGIGMTEAEAASALLPFRQPRKPVEGVMTGNGLGLPISVALLRLHRGTLQIASAPGAGTSVRCTIPV